MNSITLAIPGNLGVDAGSASDGVLIGTIAPTAVGAAILSAKSATGVSAYTDDGGVYVDDTTDFTDSGANDVAPFPAAPAVNDAFYVGADEKFSQVDIDIGTAGSGTWTVDWECWDGTQWVAVTGLTDPTSGFSAGGTGIQSITFTPPAGWAKNTVDSVLKFWLRANISAFTSITTQALITQGFVILDAATITDDTTDANDAGTNDVAVTTSYPVVGDRLYIGHASKFGKVRVDVGTAATGTLTFTWKYWDGSAWSALTVNDPTSDFSAVAGVYFISFAPPSDWQTTTVGSFTGYLVAAEVATASGATAPLLDQAWVLPHTTAACTGLTIPAGVSSFTVTGATLNALTASAAGDDTVLVLVNATSGVHRTLTWPDATATVNLSFSLPVTSGDELVLYQTAEQGTTEVADANVILMGA